ncbi:MAG TPA: zinc ribbon domain-containing protein [Candidatus Omnitrophota bacterium]|nr:zinc ribbon domain-containing protein [Candidatus Omnitrophota bacterium]HPT07682.1 zinc ribbon domain-containing protein [Candidatus Omnitrophota bacterium]
MPTYDYECTACGHRFEAFHSMNAQPLTKCPECGKKVRKLIGSGAGVIFKGSGFYATDYKKSSGTKSTPPPSCPKGCHGCQHG